MILQGKTIVVTGGASGIGRALCKRFVEEKAAAVIVADIDGDSAVRVANEIGGYAHRCDVSIEQDIVGLIDLTEAQFGPIGLFCSNAGIAAGFDTSALNAASAPNDVWSKSWDVNVMAHVYAARHLVPGMIQRGDGYFLNTASAAGLLSQIGSAVYSTTKHAAIGFAENLAISHRRHGIKVSVLCPQGVDTPMLRGLPVGPQSADGVLPADVVADATVKGLQNETFLILPHAEVAKYARRKIDDYDRWIAGMAKLQSQILSDI